MRTYIYKTSVNIGYVIDYVIKERKSLNGADSTIQKASKMIKCRKRPITQPQFEQAINMPIRHKRKSVNRC